MKAPLLLLACLSIIGCSSTPQSTKPSQYRTDVLYFRDTEGARQAAQKAIELFGGKQEVAIIAEELPPMENPAPIFQALPEYPPALKAAGIAGEVNVAFIIDEFGNVPFATVAETTHPGFNEAALAAVRRSKFKPARRWGVNVRSQLYVPLWFKPES